MDIATQHATAAMHKRTCACPNCNPKGFEEVGPFMEDEDAWPSAKGGRCRIKNDSKAMQIPQKIPM
jgi:hypothetical protein